MISGFLGLIPAGKHTNGTLPSLLELALYGCNLINHKVEDEISAPTNFEKFDYKTHEFFPTNSDREICKNSTLVLHGPTKPLLVSLFNYNYLQKHVFDLFKK